MVRTSIEMHHTEALLAGFGCVGCQDWQLRTDDKPRVIPGFHPQYFTC